ncbi:MAG: hypothetical protein AB7S68_20415 [Polyangiaceae bacterium]
MTRSAFARFTRALALPVRSIITSLLCAATVYAAPTTTRWQRATGAPSAAPVAEIAERFLSAQRSSLKLEGVALERIGVVGAQGAHIVRYQQLAAGIPVYGAQLALWVDHNGAVRAVIGDVRPLDAAPTVVVSRDAALARVKQLSGGASGKKPQLVWWRGASDVPRLVWRVDAQTKAGAERFLVDATGVQWSKRWPLEVDVLGRVSRGGSLSSPSYEDVELEALDTGSPQRLSGWDGQLDVANYMDGGFLQGHVDYQQTLTPFLDGNFLYSPPSDPLDASDGFAQVSLYEQVTRMRHSYEALGVDFSAPSWRLLVVANMLEHGKPFDNAYFAPLDMGGSLSAPNFIGVGQGSLGDFAVDPDVAMHEFTHYVNHNAINFNQGWYWTNQYGLSPWASAIDEGVADYFACSESDDAVLGDVVLEAYGLTRRLDDTSKRCPNDVGGEPHADGELIGSLGWTLRSEFGRARADRLMWSATTLLGPNSSLGDFARGLELAAEYLEGLGELSATDRALIEMLIMQRGLDDCDAVLDVSPAEPRNVLLATGTDGVGLACGELKNQGFFQQSMFQFRATPPAGSTGMTIRVELLDGSPSHLSWSVFARRGAPIGMNDDGFLPRVEVFHHSVRNITTRGAELVIDATRLPEFDPKEAYYFTIEHQNCITTQAEVSVEYTWSEPVGGAGGTGGGSGSTGGAGGVEASGGYATGGDYGDTGGHSIDWQDGDRRSSSCACAIPGGNSGSASRSTRHTGLAAMLMAVGALVRRRRRR